MRQNAFITLLVIIPASSFTHSAPKVTKQEPLYVEQCWWPNVTQRPAMKKALSAMPVFPKRGRLAHVFYINVDNATKRRDKMEQQLQNQSVPYSRYPAVNVSTIYRHADAKKPWCNGAKRGPSTYACSISHHLLYKKIVKEDPNGTNAYLILEDDAILPEGWLDKLNAAIQMVPPDATAVLAGTWGEADCKDRVAPNVYLATQPSFSHSIDTWWYSGATATVVWPFTLPMLIHKIEQRPFTCNADVNLLSSGSTRSYALKPNIVEVDSSLPRSRLQNLVRSQTFARSSASPLPLSSSARSNNSHIKQARQRKRLTRSEKVEVVSEGFL